jgi:hypothetical protein
LKILLDVVLKVLNKILIDTNKNRNITELCLRNI